MVKAKQKKKKTKDYSAEDIEFKKKVRGFVSMLLSASGLVVRFGLPFLVATRAEEEGGRSSEGVARGEEGREEEVMSFSRR